MWPTCSTTKSRLWRRGAEGTGCRWAQAGWARASGWSSIHAAISCGVCKGTAVLDLDYAEDSEADTDANFVMTGAGNIVEIQATAEKIPFSEDQFAVLLALARKGIAKLVSLQKLAVA